jgi:dTDP-4-amino-4,6-dideoxygalactose transaminase
MKRLALFGGPPVLDRVFDWRTVWPPLADETAGALQQLYYSRRWSAFDRVEDEFAQAFAAHHGAKYGIFTINGTVSLLCALAALGVSGGDEVIVPPLTWYGTAMAVRHAGATPVFVDIEPDTLCIDPDKLEAAITPRTRAVIPVHAYGSISDMDRIMDVARRHDLRVVEDCAHMHGSAWGGVGVGSIGDVGSFSFQQCKTMASGEGGICITNDAAVAERLFRVKQIGYGMNDQPGEAGTCRPPAGLVCYNFRATAFHAVILHGQLRSLDERVQRYGSAVSYLQDRLRSSTRIRFQAPGRRATRQGYFGWMMLFDDPAYADLPLAVIQQALQAEGLSLGRAEGPMYRSTLFNLASGEYRIDGQCPVTESTCRRSLWLLHPELGLERGHLDGIAEALEKVLLSADELRDSGAVSASVGAV